MRSRRTGAVYGHGGEAGQVRERDHGGHEGHAGHESHGESHGDEKEPRRGRPRSEAVERAILEAAVALLEDGVPLGGLSIERIARTAGVGKATIYRRWPGKEALFLDLLREFEPQDPELPGTSARDDLRVLLEAMRLRGLAQRSSVILHNVVVQMKSHPKLWEEYHRTVVAPRRAATLALVRRGIADGEFRADLDPELVNDLIIGPMLMRTLHRPGAPLPDDLAEQIIGTALQGVGPHPQRPPHPPHPQRPKRPPHPSTQGETPGP
ncbi:MULTISPECIES: TetR/AcrR family transcriptional regulator [unclassified Streptomyces]|uniref:TetR/AcrR family transcriptional regulator n=1 Tax=unclassified Streptomyces TaxID=2593676 RepID=UPI00382CA2B5